MQHWLKISLLLCSYGILKELRPSEGFYFEYVTGKWWNMNPEGVQQDVLPTTIFANLTFLVVMFLLTDLLRYNPLIILSAFSALIGSSFLIWGYTIFHLQIHQICNGALSATEVAYFTYIYAAVPKKYYVQVTSHTRAAIFLGYAISGTISQSLTEFKLLDCHQLNYITFSTSLAAVLWAIMLPPVKTSIYFHSENNNGKSHKERCLIAFKYMKRHFIGSYSQRYVVIWSIWWSLSVCGAVQVYLYIQPLWSSIVQGNNDQLWNGAVVTATCVASFLGAVSLGFLKIDWEKYGELTISMCSIISASLLIIGSQTRNLIVSYACFSAFGFVYSITITIASSEVAKYILEDSYGLVFGLNTLVALVLQTMMVLLFINGQLGWSLSPRQQYLVYGLYHAGIGFIFITHAFVRYMRTRCSTSHTFNLQESCVEHPPTIPLE